MKYIELERAIKLDEHEIFRLLQQADWNSIGRRLIAVARSYAGRYKWSSGHYSLLSEGRQLEDIVQEVIAKTLSGKRNWDPERGELVFWLYEQVRSEINNLYTKLPRKRELPVSVPTEQDEIEDAVDHLNEVSSADNIFYHSRPLLPEEELLRKEYIEEKSRVIWSAVDSDPELEQLVDTIIETGVTKPNELSEILNVPTSEVYRLLRKLRRRIER